ncbi:esterase/lipase family protein [Amycolatopsis sp. NPDC005003]
MTSELPWRADYPIQEQVTWDAVVVIPGIMGSELVDAATGDVLWGLRRLGWYVRAWSSGHGLYPLRATQDELDGRVGRVKATGLLRFPAFAPLLAGLEPYTPLVKRIRRIVRDRRAVLEFAYDWRLPVTHNARLLAEAATGHLANWRTLSGRSDARLCLVAHSMGGLLCSAMATISGAMDDVRTTITLGTPFGGAVKAAVILGTGKGAPVPRRRLRELAAGLPGVHDLLPSYRCVDEKDTVRRLTPDDVSRLGGSADLARDAFGLPRSAALPGHRALIGIDQPTASTLTLANGEITAHAHTFRLHQDGEFHRDANGTLVRIVSGGDGTVSRNSAVFADTAAIPLAQQHGSLARTDEAIDFVCDVLLNAEADLGPRLGEGGIGLAVPDVVAPGAEWTAAVTGVPPHLGRCVVTDADTGRAVDHPLLHRRDGDVVAAVTLPAPGVYRFEVAGGGTSAVRQLVMAMDDTSPRSAVPRQSCP